MPDEPRLFDESHGDRQVADVTRAVDAAQDTSGHRARLRKRLLEGGEDSLADHEVIEFLLMGAVPRRDTKPLARALIARFGSLAGVLNADAATLRAHPGMGDATAAALMVVAVAVRRLVRQEVREKPVIGSWQALIDYLMVDMADLTHERVRVLYLKTHKSLIINHDKRLISMAYRSEKNSAYVRNMLTYADLFFSVDELPPSFAV